MKWLLVKQWGLSPRLAEIAVYSGARDARKVKAFLNSFNTRYWMISERFNKEKAEKNLLLIAKLTAIQEGFPELYKIICTEPLMLGRFEIAYRDPALDSYQKNKVSNDLVSLVNGNDLLKRFLEYTNNIDLTEIEDIVTGKQLELMAGISTGSAIQTALSNGKTEDFSEAVKGLDKVQADDLVEYIRLMIRAFDEQKLSVTLRIWVDCALEIFSDENIWTNEDIKTTKESLANIIVETITKDEGKLIKEISDLKGIESLLQITSNSAGLANAIVQVYLKKLTTDEAISYIGLFNRQKKYFEKKFNDINSAIITALNSENEQLILKQLLTPEIRKDINDPIPSNTVLDTIVLRLDVKDEAYNLNEKRIQVIRIYQNQVDMTGFIKKWNEITKKAQSAPIEIEKTNFGLMLDTLNKIGRFEKSEDVNIICPPLLQIWAHNGKENTRKELLETFALIYPILDETQSEEVEIVIFSWFKGRPVQEIKSYLEYLTSVKQADTSEHEPLKKLALSLLEQFVEWTKTQVNVYNERVEEIVNLIVEWNRTFNTEINIGDLVESVIIKTNDSSFDLWYKKSLGNLCDCLPVDKVNSLGQIVIGRIEDPQTIKTRRSQLLDILITKLLPQNLKGSDTDRVFGLLWHDDGNMRGPICEKFESLKPKFGENDFKRNISVMAKDISDSSMDKITQKANSVTVILKNSGSIKEYDKKNILNTVPSLIHSTNSKESIGIGLEIVQSLGENDNISDDIISGLNVLSQHNDENIKGRAITLLEKFEKRTET